MFHHRRRRLLGRARRCCRSQEGARQTLLGQQSSFGPTPFFLEASQWAAPPHQNRVSQANQHCCGRAGARLSKRAWYSYRCSSGVPVEGCPLRCRKIHWEMVRRFVSVIPASARGSYCSFHTRHPHHGGFYSLHHATAALRIIRYVNWSPPPFVLGV